MSDSYTFNGGHLINGSWINSGTDSTFHATNPATGEALDGTFQTANSEQVDQAFSAATAAFKATRNEPADKWADLLDAIADGLNERADSLVARAEAESALPQTPRLRGELGRTTGQLKAFASLVREGSCVDAVIDTANPDRQPLPKPDVRRMRTGIGPVVVFGASNFPLAFGTLGGDTASALAAGNPVLVKGHPGHPGTSEIVAAAVSEALTKVGLPQGVFSLLQGVGNELGAAMVTHADAEAVGFTGSLRGGRALFDLAAQRDKPIPVFAEMGSLNPLVLLPGAIAERSEAIATGLAGSLTLGAGQFCTKPGLTLVIDDPQTNQFLDQLTSKLSETSTFTMLGSNLQQAFGGVTQSFGSTDGVNTRLAGSCDGHAGATAGLYEVDSATWKSQQALHEEAFGPAGLVVRCKSLEDLVDTLSHVEGSLTGSVHAGEGDAESAVSQVAQALAAVSGRVIFNGYPTGVEVCHAMHHGGPYPATTASGTTSVGTAAIQRFMRPVAYQDAPQSVLPTELQDTNNRGIMRQVDGEYTRDAISK